MLTERPTAPLSPPTSPRMSDTPAKATDYNWQTPSYLTTTSQTPREESAHRYERLTPTQSYVGEETRLHVLPQHETRSNPEQESSEANQPQHLVGAGLPAAAPSDLPPTAFGGSAPASPSGRLTPRSGENTHHDEQMLDDIDEDDLGPAEGDDGVDKTKMTPAELRAHKRKMKRFRYLDVHRYR